MSKVTRTTGAAVATALAAVGGLHAVWAVSPWPLRSRAEFADLVVGVDEAQAPTPAMCGAVAAALGCAGYLIAARAGVLPAAGPRWVHGTGTGVAAAVLLTRGLAGPRLLERRGLGRTDRFRALDRRYYSPFCVALGTGAAVVAVRGT
jgi:hypothetical protein